MKKPTEKDNVVEFLHKTTKDIHASINNLYKQDLINLFISESWRL